MKLDFIDGDAKKATEEYDHADTTWGVFKAYGFFPSVSFCILGLGTGHYLWPGGGIDKILRIREWASKKY